MPSAYADWGADWPCMLATCWAQTTSWSPTIPARGMNQDTQAILDTGSVVTLLRPDLAGGREGKPMEVACVHGDIRTYEGCHVVVRTPLWVFTARAGIVPHLPVPLQIWRDCPIFNRLWDPTRELRDRTFPPGDEESSAGVRGHTAPVFPQGIDGNGPGVRGGRTLPTRIAGTPSRHPGHPHSVRVTRPPGRPGELPPHRVFRFPSGEGGRLGPTRTVRQRPAPGRGPETRLEPCGGPRRSNLGLSESHSHFSTRGGLLYEWWKERRE